MLVSGFDFKNSTIVRTEVDAEYVSDFLNEEIQNWTRGYNVFVSCGTGTGKTTFAINLAELTEKKVLIVANRRANVQQIKLSSTKLYLKNGIISMPDVISYQSLEADIKKDSNFLSCYDFLILDEAHYFIKDAEFNPKTNLSFLKIFFANSVKIFMSATIDQFETFYVGMLQNFKIFKFGHNLKYKFQKSKLQIKSVESIESYDQITELAKTLEGKILIFVSSKKIGKKLVKELNEFKKAFFISSESKESMDKDEQDRFEELLENEMFDYDILVTTSVLDNGVNIIDRDLKNIIIDANDRIEIIQMIGRKRPIDSDDSFNLFLISSKINGATYQTLNEMQEAKDYLAKYGQPAPFMLDNNEMGISYRECVYYDPYLNLVYPNVLGLESVKIKIQDYTELTDSESSFLQKIKWIEENSGKKINESCNAVKNQMLIKQLDEYFNKPMDNESEIKKFRKKFTEVFWSLFGKDKDESHRNNRILSLKKIKVCIEKNKIPMRIELNDKILIVKRCNYE